MRPRTPVGHPRLERQLVRILHIRVRKDISQGQRQDRQGAQGGGDERRRPRRLPRERGHNRRDASGPPDRPEPGNPQDPVGGCGEWRTERPAQRRLAQDAKPHRRCESRWHRDPRHGENLRKTWNRRPENLGDPPPGRRDGHGPLRNLGPPIREWARGRRKSG